MFLNPLWLWGLSAAGIPVLVHLFFRRRYRTVRWAAMRFLRQAIEQSSRRQRLTHWLLLAVRMLILAFLALALARPYLQSTAAAGLGLDPQSWVLVVDHSMSMGCQAGGQTAWERAQAAARSWAEGLSGGDRVAVVAAPGPGGISSFTGDLSRVRAALSGITLSNGVADLASALSEGAAILEKSLLPQARFLVITDLQRGSFGDPGGSSSSPSSWGGLAKRLAGKASVAFLDVGAQSPANLSVESLRLTSGAALSARSVTVAATVANHGSRETVDLPVTFSVDGVKKESRLVTIGPRASGACTMTLQFDEPGFHWVSAEIPADDLAADNLRHLSISARRRRTLVCVTDRARGSREEKGSTRPTAFIEWALAPDPATASWQVQVTAPADLALDADCEAVLLVDVERLEASQVGMLERFASRGGGIGFFFGQAVDPSFYNSELFREGKGVGPVRLVGIREAKEELPLRLVAGDAAGPFLDFLPKGRGDLGRVAVWKRWEADPPADPAARVLLRFDDGKPALVERPYGRGVVAAWTCGWDPAWSNLPARPLFVPWIHQVASLLADPAAKVLNLDAGGTLFWPLEPAAAGSLVTLLSPRGEPTRLTPVQEKGEWSVASGPLEQAGLWKLEIGRDAAVPVAVGWVNAESDLARIAEHEIVRRLAGVEVQVGRSPTVRRSTAQGAQLSRPLLMGVLVLAYLEAFIAWKTGNQKVN